MKRFGQGPNLVTVEGWRDPDDPGRCVGSRISHRGRIFEIPQYPRRVKDVRVLGADVLIVHIGYDGDELVLEPHEAVQS